MMQYEKGSRKRKRIILTNFSNICSIFLISLSTRLYSITSISLLGASSLFFCTSIFLSHSALYLYFYFYSYSYSDLQEFFTSFSHPSPSGHTTCSSLSAMFRICPIYLQGYCKIVTYSLLSSDFCHILERFTHLFRKLLAYLLICPISHHWQTLADV